MLSENDIVLIYYNDKPAVFARIESVDPDIKEHWYQVTFLLLTIPMQTFTWILKDAYINGSPFTMGGRPVRIEEVKKTEIKKNVEEQGQPEDKKRPYKKGTIISFKKP